MGPETGDGRTLSGISEIAVMPCAAGAGTAADRRRRFLSHTRYWKSRGRQPPPDPPPEHVRVLREALRLGEF